MNFIDQNHLNAAGDILIVDDAPENLKFLKEILNAAGYRVRPASDGELALRSVQAKHPALILLDIRMPGMDGFEVCRRLKENADTREIPIIFASALVDTAEKVKGFELGAVDYITKPLNAQEVLARVKTHLSLYLTQQLLETKNRQLEEAELRYRTIAEFTCDWETWLSPEGDWLFCSPSCLRITGYSAEEFMSNIDLFFNIVHPNDRYLVENHYCNDEPVFHSLEYRILHKEDKREIWIEHACQPVFDSNGVYWGRRASNRDITDRKKMEMALIQARNAAEAANLAKSTFIATMSHELRTPLNAILGFSELLSKDDSLSAVHRKTLNIINRSGAHLLNMINDVLEIAKIEAGRLEIENRVFDLLKLLQDIGDMISIKASEKQLNFRLEIGSDVPQYIKADNGKLRQILLNLLSNAIKFTKEGGVILRVNSGLFVDANQLTLNFEVADSGVGIPKKFQEDLFKPFMQFARLNIEVEGSGLGLAISKSLVELMGGHIYINSVVGVGTTFKIQLPVALSQADNINIAEDYHAVKSIAPNQPEWRLLIVDDNPDNRLLLATVLSNVGFLIREAENGEEAIRQFVEWQPHLIWMDIRMPVMDGYEATAKIRQLPGGDRVKIIALTASVFKEAHANIINAGCDAILHKPFHIQELFDVLAQYLGVEFIYLDKPVADVVPHKEITWQMLVVLPLEIRQKLYQAAQNLDIEETESVIRQIQPIAPETADGLQVLVERYQFEQLINLLEQTDT